MNVPKGFAPEKQKKEIEDIVKKTLVDKVLVENIAKELKTLLEGERLAKILKINFRKEFNLFKHKNLKTTTERAERELLLCPTYPEEVKDYIKVVDRDSLREQEVCQILEQLRDLEPNIKEDDIVQADPYHFNIISKDAMYKLKLDINEYKESVDTGKTIPSTKTFKKTVNKPFQKKIEETIEETIELPLIKVYFHLKLHGEVKYAKFNQEHNKKIIRVLKERGYKVSVNF